MLEISTPSNGHSSYESALLIGRLIGKLLSNGNFKCLANDWQDFCAQYLDTHTFATYRGYYHFSEIHDALVTKRPDLPLPSTHSFVRKNWKVFTLYEQSPVVFFHLWKNSIVIDGNSEAEVSDRIMLEQTNAYFEDPCLFNPMIHAIHFVADKMYRLEYHVDTEMLHIISEAVNVNIKVCRNMTCTLSCEVIEQQSNSKHHRPCDSENERDNHQWQA